MPLLAGFLCLLLLGFAGASYGAVRWDVVPSPTEVVNTGRSEVTGSVNLIVRGTGVTGTSAGGDVQIGLIYTNPSMQIDNTVSTGIKLISSAALAGATITVDEGVENFDLNGRCTGRITINIPGGVNVSEANGDFLRIEGVRGRIDASLAVTPGTDLFVDLQSINDPAANSFVPDRVRVAKSLDGMNIEVESATLLLCFPTTGVPPAGEDTPDYAITITEGFARAFVDNDDNGANTDRVDSSGAHLGLPTNSTQIRISLQDIPASVDAVEFPESVPSDEGISSLELVEGSDDYDDDAGVATATYSYEAENQTGLSDINVEEFAIAPVIVLNEDATETGTVMVAVTLAPTADEIAQSGDCVDPGDDEDNDRPRFLEMYESDDVATNNPPDDPYVPYALIIRCNCYMLFTYVTADAGFDTGIAIANTTGDEAVFADNEAPDQLGKITFYFYDKAEGFVGSTTTTEDVLQGRSFVALISGLLPENVTAFSGYVIAKADFQFCHGFAFIADSSFASIAHGYVANIIPDPAIKNLGGRRAASAAADTSNGGGGIPAGESLNN
jgi:hypothetical protein